MGKSTSLPEPTAAPTPTVAKTVTCQRGVACSCEPGRHAWKAKQPEERKS
jgi:hypothetical protein